MARWVSHSTTRSAPANWSGGLRALTAAAVMAGLWLTDGPTPALFAAIAVALYAAVGPLRVGAFIFSRRTALLAFQLSACLIAAVTFIAIVGHATDSGDVVIASLANLAFIGGLAMAGAALGRVIWRAIARSSPRATRLWSSAAAHLQSQLALLHLYSRPGSGPQDAGPDTAHDAG
ncbi:MAG TPA: hypothetical protein VIT93_07000 [Dehalococcoidia bacterium]